MISLNIQMAPPTRNNPDGSNSSQDPMLQILQLLVSDREAERAERQANLATLQQIAQMANNNNNQGNGNHDNPGSNKLKKFRTLILQCLARLKSP
jgi:hypothetical protein